MLDNRSPLIGFQTFYASKENSLCPQIPELVKIGKTFVNKNLLNNISKTIISLRYGRRVLINSDNSNHLLSAWVLVAGYISTGFSLICADQIMIGAYSLMSDIAKSTSLCPDFGALQSGLEIPAIDYPGIVSHFNDLTV